MQFTYCLTRQIHLLTTTLAVVFGVLVFLVIPLTNIV